MVLTEKNTEIRLVTAEDIPAILMIEEAAYDFPWTEGLLSDCLKPNYYFYVLTRNSRILTYGIMTCILNEAHILNLCVDPAFRRQGLGKTMLYHLLGEAESQEVHTVFLEVRKSNSPAQELYEGNGFNQIGERRGYYPGENGREDAMIYARQLGVSPV